MRPTTRKQKRCQGARGMPTQCHKKSSLGGLNPCSTWSAAAFSQPQTAGRFRSGALHGTVATGALGASRTTGRPKGRHRTPSTEKCAAPQIITARWQQPFICGSMMFHGVPGSCWINHLHPMTKHERTHAETERTSTSRQAWGFHMFLPFLRMPRR